MRLAAIIAAAGSGTRLGADKPKALVELAGEPLVIHAIRSMLEADVHDIVVTIPGEAEAEFMWVLDKADLSSDMRGGSAGEPGSQIVLTPGGATRQASVLRGLDAVREHFPDTTHVLVHDAARALTPSAMIRRVYGMLAVGAPAVVPALPVVDTLKEVRPDPDALAAAELTHSELVPPYTQAVERTVDRSVLRAVQTPQGFAIDVLADAHASTHTLSEDEQAAAPDDAALVELAGVVVQTVPGDQRALKVTTPFDLAVAEMLASQKGE
ncbi:MAG: 2-C-methyl-D-erythritol 4-phosphate cytidylyltransferase [Actinomycetaceae bacterium]|nr:2-C-methyl-D-erythritol 4-phosphate cytidylyltransferase [Arcanobacterium sp.]MDD7505610.1 2-C-methyl-D-erythritol 4-phosphate cytidylyltransferase [Actinomycetaceae bacterium]